MASLEDDFLHEASNDVQNLVYSDTEAFIDSDDEADDDDDPTGLSSANSTVTIENVRIHTGGGRYIIRTPKVAHHPLLPITDWCIITLNHNIKSLWPVCRDAYLLFFYDTIQYRY